MAARTVPYDPRRAALYTPEIGETILTEGRQFSEALLGAETARLVYKKFEWEESAAAEITAALGRAGFVEIEFFSSVGSQALAARNAQTESVMVAFRGTEQDPTDIATNARTWPSEWKPGGAVHAGFLEAFAVIWPKIESWLQDHPGRLLLAGHSLGAALATLAASLAGASKLVTFGSPRVGDAAFVKTLSGEIERYVDCCDVVCQVPPESLGFVHCGGLQYIDRTGAIRKDPPDAFVTGDQLKAREEYISEYAWRLGAVAVRDLADHAPINYVFAVQAAGS
jgi:hypothetical protein